MRKILKRYIPFINSAISTIAGVVLGLFVEELCNDDFFNWILFIFLAFLVVLEIILIGYPRRALKAKRESIFDNLLKACLDLLFVDCDARDWSICGMIQVPFKNERRTPYFTNDTVNSAIRNHRTLTFGDVGKNYFSGKKHIDPCFSIRISKDDHRNRSLEYRLDVPSNLRGIVSTAIFSPDEADSKSIIGVLEFDIFANSDTTEDFPEELFDKITSPRNKESLAKWARAMAVLLSEL
jgi:hypothetical protein